MRLSLLAGLLCLLAIAQQPARADLFEVSGVGQFFIGFPTYAQDDYYLQGYLNTTGALLTPSNQIQYLPTSYTMGVYDPRSAPTGTFTGTAAYTLNATELTDQQVVVQSINQNVTVMATDAINTGSSLSSTISVAGSTVAQFAFKDGTTLFVQLPSGSLTHTGDSLSGAGSTVSSPVATAPLTGQTICTDPNTPPAQCISEGALLFLFDFVLPAIFDPPLATAYEYQSEDGKFTQVFDFPAGFSGPFEVSSGSTVFGFFQPGQSFTFPNGGVSEFEISGISPAVDSTNQLSFPIGLNMDTEGAQFSIAPLTGPAAATPEPSSWALLAAGFAVLLLRRPLGRVIVLGSRLTAPPQRQTVSLSVTPNRR